MLCRGAAAPDCEKLLMERFEVGMAATASNVAAAVGEPEGDEVPEAWELVR